MITDFGANRRRPSFSALAFHKGCEDRNTDAWFNTADDPSTSDKNSVNFHTVTSNP